MCFGELQWCLENLEIEFNQYSFDDFEFFQIDSENEVFLVEFIKILDDIFEDDVGLVVFLVLDGGDVLLCILVLFVFLFVFFSFVLEKFLVLVFEVDEFLLLQKFFLVIFYLMLSFDIQKEGSVWCQVGFRFKS